MRATAAILAAGAAVSACTSLEITPTAVDQRSPAAARIRAEEGVERRMPTFADIPGTPRDVPTVAQYDSAVNAVRGEGAGLQAWARDNPQTNVDTEAFVAANRDRASQGGAIPSADQTRRTEAFAEEARRRATPPPPPQ